jgi:hypothetical protein
MHVPTTALPPLPHRYPAGSLVYWVLWDVFAFVFGWAVTLPFLLSELSRVHSFDDLLLDWRLRCALYFCKVHSSPSSMFSRGMQVLTTALPRPPNRW